MCVGPQAAGCATSWMVLPSVMAYPAEMDTSAAESRLSCRVAGSST